MKAPHVARKCGLSTTCCTINMPFPFTLRIRCRQRQDDESGPNASISKQNESEASGVMKHPKASEEKNSKTQRWRAKMKQDNPERYQTLLNEDKRRKKLDRKKMSIAERDLQNCSSEERLKLEKLVERKKRHNVKAAARTRKMRARQKEGRESDLREVKAKPKKGRPRAVRPGEVSPRAIGPRSTASQREKDRLRKRKERARLTVERKREILQQRRERYARKVSPLQPVPLKRILKWEGEELIALREELNDLGRRLKEKDKRLQNLIDKLGIHLQEATE